MAAAAAAPSRRVYARMAYKVYGAHVYIISRKYGRRENIKRPPPPSFRPRIKYIITPRRLCKFIASSRPSAGPESLLNARVLTVYGPPAAARRSFRRPLPRLPQVSRTPPPLSTPPPPAPPGSRRRAIPPTERIARAADRPPMLRAVHIIINIK